MSDALSEFKKLIAASGYSEPSEPIDGELEMTFGFWCKFGGIRPLSDEGQELYAHLKQMLAERRAKGEP